MSEALVQVIIAIIAALPGLLALIAQRKKTNADAAGTITDAAGDLVTLYKDRIEALERAEAETKATIKQQEQQIATLQDDLRHLSALVREYRRGIMILISQIESLGDDPAYRLADD